MRCWADMVERERQHQDGLETERELALERIVAEIEKCEPCLDAILYALRRKIREAYLKGDDINELIAQSVWAEAERKLERMKDGQD